MRKYKIAAAAAVVVIVAIAIITMVDFSAPGLSKRILDAAGEGAGIELEAGSFRLNLVRGMILEDVIARTEIAAGVVTTTVDRVVLEHRLLPLLLGDIVIDQLILENPTIDVVSEGAVVQTAARGRPFRVQRISTGAPSSAAPAPPEAQDDTPSPTGVDRSITVHSVRIDNATLKLRAGAGAASTMQANGLTVELTELYVDEGSTSVAVGLSGSGHLDVDEVLFENRVATGNRAALSAADGIFTLTGLELTTAEGRVGLEQLVVDLNADPYTYRTMIAADDLDLNALWSIADSTSLGPARLELDGEGAGPDTSGFVGSGRIFLAAGRIPDAPVLEQADAFLNAPLAGTRYDATTIEFTVADNSVTITSFQLITEALHVDTGGDLGIAGDLAIVAQVSLPADNVNLGDWQGDFSDGVIEALTDEKGWVSIPLLIDGTIEEPRVRPDSEVLMVALQQSAGRTLGNWLKGVIKRDD